MDTLLTFVGLLMTANPAVLITLVCIVALIVVAECVRQLCKVMRKRGDD